MKSDVGYPTSEEYLKVFIEKTILPSEKKQSNTVFFVRGTGRNSLLKYTWQNKPKIKKELCIDLNGCVLLTVDTKKSDLILKTWIHILSEQGFSASDFEDLNELEILSKLTKEKGKRVLLCVWVHEEGVDIDFLETLRQVNSVMIDFQFGFPFEVPSKEMKNYLGSLAQFALQNIWYMPFYAQQDVEAVINNQIALGFAKEADISNEKVIENSYGYPLLTRYLLRTDDGDLSLDEPEIHQYFVNIWDGLCDVSKLSLFEIVDGNDDLPVSDYLVNTGLVKKDKKKWYITVPLFRDYIKNLAKESLPHIAQKENEMMIGDILARSVLSDQEYLALECLFEHKSEIVDRDTLAETIWQDEWEEKYSDWAIDQLISRVRKKINDRSKDGLIHTIRGKGFLLK